MIPKPRPEIEKMSPYVPGEQPAGHERVVKLNTNEAAFGPSEKVLAAIRAVSAENLRRYPSPRSDAFRQAAAKRHGVSPDQILAGNGSDDLLTILTRTFVAPGGVVASPWPTYSLYPTLCQIQGAVFRPVRWGDHWSLPVDALLAEKASAIYLANPNAPSGTVVSADNLAALAKRHKGLLLVDEAYADYAEADCVELTKEFGNVVVLRTLSKGYALAGLRLGYAIGHAEMIEQMDKVRDSYNVDAVAQAAGVAALGDVEYFRNLWREVGRERQRLTQGLEELGFTVAPSQANFVFAEHDDAGSLYAALKEQGILVRYWDKPDLSGFLRITVGTTQENTAVLEALSGLVGSR